MVKKPAVIIIARHGTRLDAFDKDWHLSSTSPHDPPLTYGGWNQSRSLGVRIGRLLRAKEQELADSRSQDATPCTARADVNRTANSTRSYTPVDGRPSRPLKVFVHTSPYQRCVQTSVAITAGIVQYRGLAAHTHGRSPSTHSPPRSVNFSASPHSRPLDEAQPPSPTSSPFQMDPAQGLKSVSSTDLPNVTSAPAHVDQNAILRIDACLGEWLSPEYSILPKRPPNSDALVAAAKAELSRPSDAIESFSPVIPASQGSLWGSNNSSMANTPDSRFMKSPERPGVSLRSLSSAAPGTAHTPWSADFDHAHPFRHVSNPTPGLTTQLAAGYQAPIPAYAILPTEPIPKGYVAHARDACTDIDFEWDSLVPPLAWGDGGDYGEEWSALHKRFRNCLDHLINYYTSGHLADGFSPSHHRLYGHDPDDETAIIIVTHSAGCNALIGALTDQPVLLDIGMASLTMAVRKDEPIVEATELSQQTPLSTLYDMEIVASVDHLRASAQTASSISTAAKSQISGPTSIGGLGRRNTVLTSHASSSLPDDHWTEQSAIRRSSVNTTSSSSRRPCISPVLSYRSDSLTSISSSNGLWTPTGPLPTSEYGERINTSPPFSSPLSGSPVREADIITPPGGSMTSMVPPDKLGSSMASDATICAVDGANTPKPSMAGSLKTSALLNQTANTMNRLPMTTSPLADALASARIQDDEAAMQAPGTVDLTSPLGITRPVDGEQTADASGRQASPDSANGTPTRPRATSRPQPIPHRGLQRAISQKGLWGSAPAGVLEHRNFGLGKHP